MSDTPSIRWQTVYKQLEESGRQLDAVFAPDPELINRTLARRAESLSQRTERQVKDETLRHLLLVRVGDYTAGIEVQWIQEVMGLSQEYAPVPDAHELLLGVINVHNQIVNLVNPWALMNETAPATASTFPHAVLLRHAHLRIAIGCSEVINLVELPPSAWQSDRLFLYQADESPAVLLDIHALLATWEKQSSSPS